MFLNLPCRQAEEARFLGQEERYKHVVGQTKLQGLLKGLIAEHSIQSSTGEAMDDRHFVGADLPVKSFLIAGGQFCDLDLESHVQGPQILLS